MAADVKPPVQTAHREGDQCIVLRGIGWNGYTTMLRLRGERPSPGINYLDGAISLVSPSFSHERLADRFDSFVKEVVVGLGIPCIPTRSTTFRRRRKDVGVEGDATFYLANEARIRGKDTIDLRIDPPPDLAIEAVMTHGAAAAVKIYRRLRVPEVWIGDDSELRILALQANGRYLRVSTSVAFPFLTADEIFQWVSRLQTRSETEWIMDLRSWVKGTLAPRVQERLAKLPEEI